MSYFSLALRVPEAGAVEPKALARFYGMITRVPPARSVYRRFLSSTLAQCVTRGRGLDLGTGPGYLAVEIARHRPGLEMVGLDLAAHMVRQARQHAVDSKLDGKELWPQADGHRLPFRDNSFDLVVSSFSLHHWAAPLHVLNEIARVLVPEGQYYIADLCRHVTLLQRLVAYASIPALSLPFGSYRGYGGYYESVRAGYTREEAQDLIHQSALPPATVGIDSTCCVPLLIISSRSLDRPLVGHQATSTNSPAEASVLADPEREPMPIRLSDRTSPEHSARTGHSTAASIPEEAAREHDPHEAI